ERGELGCPRAVGYVGTRGVGPLLDHPEGLMIIRVEDDLTVVAPAVAPRPEVDEVRTGASLEELGAAQGRRGPVERARDRVVADVSRAAAATEPDDHIARLADGDRWIIEVQGAVGDGALLDHRARGGTDPVPGDGRTAADV